jgi:hypothetical protein
LTGVLASAFWLKLKTFARSERKLVLIQSGH